MTYPSPRDGRPINKCWLVPRTREDLAARRRAIKCWADASYGFLGRSPDHVASFIKLTQDDAGQALGRTADGAFDFVFLDSERSEYVGWWPDLKRVLQPGGLLVADNATSHIEEMAPFVAIVLADSSFTATLVPVGNGEFLAYKALA